MAAFASGRRSPGIRFFVVLLALIMAFSAVALPVYALSESVALFGLAAVLSSATAALGFKLTNNQQGIDTINRMCSDFVKSALAPALVVIGTRVNGLQNDMAYIKMQVANAKTYLDERVLAWVQKWLSENGVYNSGSVSFPDYSNVTTVNRNLLSKSIVLSLFPSESLLLFNKVFQRYNLTDEFLNSHTIQYNYSNVNKSASVYVYENVAESYNVIKVNDALCVSPYDGYYFQTDGVYCKYSYSYSQYSGYDQSQNLGYLNLKLTMTKFLNKNTGDIIQYYVMSNYGDVITSTNDTGLSGQDTIGEDYKDKTLEQILQGLKEKAPDWYDAGADSSTNSTVGAKDLPVTVPVGAASENPALNPDAVYNPPFDQPLDDIRSGATSSTTVADGVTNSNTAESSEAAAATVSETQTIIDSLINWANNYISPDKGLFSKFPLCIPYDVYLLVSSALGVDARDISDIVNADTSDIGSLSNDSTSVNPQSDFVPVLDIQHDFNLDGYTYPIRISFDLTPYEPLIKINRIFLSIALIAELIGSEYKRIRWGK